MFIFCTKKFKNSMAERQGFEPWIRLPVYYLSKVARSTTLPPLQWHDFTTTYYFFSKCFLCNKIEMHYPPIFLNKLPTVLSTLVRGINFVINAVLLFDLPGMMNCLSFSKPSRHSTATSCEV